MVMAAAMVVVSRFNSNIIGECCKTLYVLQKYLYGVIKWLIGRFNKLELNTEWRWVFLNFYYEQILSSCGSKNHK